jgi:hypothetical protein
VEDPKVALRWNDPDNTASLNAPVEIRLGKDQSFEIRGVTSGNYLLLASGTAGGVPLSGRVPLNIGDTDIEGVNVVIQAPSILTGKIHLDDDDSALPADLSISLEPRRPTTLASRSKVTANGEFAVSLDPGETYDLSVLNEGDDTYLKSVLIANSERLSQGLEAPSNDTAPGIDVFLSSRGAQVVGRVVTDDPKVVASGANVALVPDPPGGRVQAYQAAHADEYGNFFLRGLSPGKYVLLAWLGSPPCEVYNPDDLATCRAQGLSVTVAEGEQKTLQITGN